MTLAPARRTVSLAAALALAGVGFSPLAALAAPAVAVSPDTPPIANSPFTVTLTGLTAGTNYRLALTDRVATNLADTATANTCGTSVPVTGTGTTATATCTVTPSQAGAWQLKLISGNATAADTNIDVATPVGATTAPVAVDRPGTANDSLTFTYTPNMTWQWRIGNTGDWNTVTFPANAAAGEQRTVAITGTADQQGAVDVDFRAVAADGHQFPTGAPTGTLRLTTAETVQPVLTIPATAQPRAVDNVGTDNDQVVLTQVEGVQWNIVTTDAQGVQQRQAVTFGANQTSATVRVTPTGPDYTVHVEAAAVSPRSFSNGRLAERFDVQFTNVRADPTSTRVAGETRIDTAVEASRRYFTPETQNVYVANAMRFPDALAGGPAAAKQDAPLLLTFHDSLPESVRAELTRLTPATIYVVGGTSVVSEAVEAQLRQIAPVRRLQGENRIATAANVSGIFTPTDVTTVYLATQRDFPDALSAGSAAATAGMPLLLSDRDQLMEPTRAALRELNPARVVLVGGADVLSTAVVRDVATVLPRAEVTRLAGANRYDTAAAVLERTATRPTAQNTGTARVFLATGQNFPDALAGIPAAKKANAPLTLSARTCVPQSVKAQLDALTGLTEVVRLGGTDVLADYSIRTAACSY